MPRSSITAGTTANLLAAVVLVAPGGSCLPLPDNDADGGWTPMYSSDPCESEADCTTTEHCHPTLRICVENCELVDGSCDLMPGTSCSSENIITPINGMGFKGICVCDPENDTCPEGEVCHPLDLTCDIHCTGDHDCGSYERERSCSDIEEHRLCVP